MHQYLPKPAERVKELDCLYGISNLIETPDISIEGILRGTLELLPRAFQCPHLARARITLKNQAYGTANFRESPWRIANDIKVQGELTGTVEVCYRQEPFPGGQAPFLPEEVKLINAVAELLGRVIDRKRVEETLREREEKYRSLFENAVEGFFRSTPAGRFLNVNPAFARIFGYGSPEELISTISDISEQYYVHPHDRRRYMEILREQGTVENFEINARRKDGAAIWISNSTRAIVDKSGNIVCYEGIVEDITDRKRAEEALRESEIKYRTLVENIPQKIFIKDRASRYVSVNENYARDLGIRPEEVRGKSDYDFFSKELAEKYRADDQRIMRTNRTEHIEERYIQNGRETWVHTVKAPVRDGGGEITGVFGIFMDISDRKRAEEALTAESLRLAETNTALRVLLQRREEDQKEMERKILTNIKALVLPHLEKLSRLKLNEVQANCLDMAAANLRQVISPFLQNLAARFADFTPREIQVANMVKEGKTSKEIAHLINSSIRSVEFHRDNIRKKLGLNHKKSNLRMFLMNLSE